VHEGKYQEVILITQNS